MNYGNNPKLTYNLRVCKKGAQNWEERKLCGKIIFPTIFTSLSSNKKLLHFGVSELINRLMKCIKFLGQIARFSKKQK